MFGDIFRGRRVLVTGHTGFKGSWLCHWLIRMGADVAGLALAPDTTPHLFGILELNRRLRHHEADIRDPAAVMRVVAAVRPEIVFHMAAQSLVRRGYRDPVGTWNTNVGGTIHLLEVVRTVGGVRACVLVSSDKCYENREQAAGYREGDALGGHDPYSSSKGAMEIAISSWRRSFFQDPAGCLIASARAGNVIGGGDWAEDRIVVDFVTAIGAGRPLALRNPHATRPWQHVLEPLSGYLQLAARLMNEDGSRFADAWNFGPQESSVVEVGELAHRLVSAWGAGAVTVVSNAGQPHEAGLLKLDCTRARQCLEWEATWDLATTVAATAAWYRAHLAGEDMMAVTDQQMKAFAQAAATKNLAWSH